MDGKKTSLRTNSKFSGLINTKTTIKFFCLFILVYSLMMIAWPVVNTAYLKFYQSAGGFVFSPLGKGRVVRFSQPENSKFDICIIAFNQHSANDNGEIQATRFHHNVLYGEYIQISFLIGLIVATPLSLKRKAQSLLWALVLMHVFIFIKLMIVIFNLFNIADEKNIELADRNIVLMEHLTIGFIIAFLIWILVAFRGNDYFKTFTQTLLPKKSSQPHN